MHIRAQRIVLICLSVLCCIGSVFVLLWASLWPCSITQVVVPDALLSPGTETSNDESSLTLDDFNAIMNRRFRPLLVEIPMEAPKPKVAVVSNAPPLRVTLVAIIGKPPNRRAAFKTAAGEYKYSTVGGEFGDPPNTVSVVELEPDHATVNYRGETITLKLSRKGGS